MAFPKSSGVNWASYRPGPWLISYVGNRQAQITSELGTASTVHLLQLGLCCPHEGRTHSPAGPGRNSGTRSGGGQGRSESPGLHSRPLLPGRALGSEVEVQNQPHLWTAGRGTGCRAQAQSPGSEVEQKPGCCPAGLSVQGLDGSEGCRCECAGWTT